ESFGVGIALRFLVGLFLAGVYPPGMKIMATWFRRGRGTALGVLVGALTLGKASPYLMNAVGSADWRAHVLFVSALAAAGGRVVSGHRRGRSWLRCGWTPRRPHRAHRRHVGGDGLERRVLSDGGTSFRRAPDAAARSRGRLGRERCGRLGAVLRVRDGVGRPA